ncbi:MAG: Trm112 family protein [Deltaproteobacteria bacterium]|nr:Trm112 family protein [Deltaproteobacteria bacterium]
MTGPPNPALAEAIAELLACPCGGALVLEGASAACTACARRFPVRDGVLDFLDDPAPDAASGREGP